MLTAARCRSRDLRISSNAHLIMPYHRKLDAVMERYLGRQMIGTTKKGIGPAYTDKYSRQGIRIQDLFDPKIFRDKLDVALTDKNKLLTRVYNQLPMDADSIAAEYLGYAEALLPFVTDTSLLIWEAIDAGQEVLFEGAQGTSARHRPWDVPLCYFLQPHCRGRPHRVGDWAKGDRPGGRGRQGVHHPGWEPGRSRPSFRTRSAKRMVTVGGEFGTVTGRRRRCGWLDLVALRYSARVNSLTDIFLTKLDILSEFDTLQVAVAYSSLGETYTELPRQQRVLYNCAPVYEELPGWGSDITGVRTFADLPKEAQQYIEFIEDSTRVPIGWVSVGPERQQVLNRST